MSVQELYDTSTWIRTGRQCKCIVHTETQPDPGGRAIDRGAGLRPFVGCCAADPVPRGSEMEYQHVLHRRLRDRSCDR
jgi:hypothetical protein